MATTTPTFRCLSSFSSLFRQATNIPKNNLRTLTTYHHSTQPTSSPPAHSSTTSTPPFTPSLAPRHIKTYPPPQTPAQTTKDPLSALHALQISALDPSSSRTFLFNPSNPDRARVGDILLVRSRTGDPFAGVCINIRHRGVETAILLRNQLTRVGVEMWFKIYSPNVTGIEVVQRSERRLRRARATYFRKEKHDLGSLAGVVLAYTRARNAARGGGGGKEAGGKGKKGKGPKGKRGRDGSS